MVNNDHGDNLIMNYNYTKKIFHVVLIITAFCFNSLYAEKGAQILELIPSAKSIALGGAFCAYSEDAASVLYNPAGLSAIDHIQVSLAKNYLFDDMDDIFKKDNYMEYYGAAYSLRDIWISNIEDRGTIAVFFNKADTAYVGSRSDDSEGGLYDQVLTVSYAKSVYSIQESGSVSLGLNMKFFEEDISKTEDADGSALDIGAQFKYPGKTLFAGLSVLNIGGKYERGSSEFRLPLKVLAGLYGRAFKRRLGISSDLIMEAGKELNLGLGVSYLLLKPVDIRVGYNPALTSSGFTGGLGLVFKEIEVLFFYIREISIDFALPVDEECGNFNRIGLNLKLGAY
ncbi:hypothetical protein ACFLUV_00965 [Elusimicrobiota bacterium]